MIKKLRTHPILKKRCFKGKIYPIFIFFFLHVLMKGFLLNRLFLLEFKKNNNNNTQSNTQKDPEM